MTTSLDARAVAQPGGLYSSINNALLQGLLAYFQHQDRQRAAERELRREERANRREQLASALAHAERYGVVPSAEHTGWLAPEDRVLIERARDAFAHRLLRDDRAHHREQLATALANAERYGVVPSAEQAGWVTPDDQVLLERARDAFERGLLRDERAHRREQLATALAHAERYGVVPSAEQAGWLAPEDRVLLERAREVFTRQMANQAERDAYMRALTATMQAKLASRLSDKKSAALEESAAAMTAPDVLPKVEASAPKPQSQPKAQQQQRTDPNRFNRIRGPDQQRQSQQQSKPGVARPPTAAKAPAVPGTTTVSGLPRQPMRRWQPGDEVFPQVSEIGIPEDPTVTYPGAITDEELAAYLQRRQDVKALLQLAE